MMHIGFYFLEQNLLKIKVRMIDVFDATCFVALTVRPSLSLL